MDVSRMNLLKTSAAALIATTFAAPVNQLAAAPTPRPDLVLKTKAAEITVTLDKPIKADPVLATNLMAEGRRWADGQRSDADATRRSEPKYFPKDGYSYERRYKTASIVVDRYVSILRHDSEYTGGAHPNSNVETILWDRSAGRRINIRRFFTETADDGPTLRAMVQGVIAALKLEKAKRDAGDQPEADWAGAIGTSLLKIGPVVLAPSSEPGKSAGLTFNYPPYAVGSYAEGGYRAFVPWQTLKPYLSPEGGAIFGGERPTSDIDKDEE